MLIIRVEKIVTNPVTRILEDVGAIYRSRRPTKRSRIGNQCERGVEKIQNVPIVLKEI